MNADNLFAGDIVYFWDNKSHSTKEGIVFYANRDSVVIEQRYSSRRFEVDVDHIFKRLNDYHVGQEVLFKNSGDVCIITQVEKEQSNDVFYNVRRLKDNYQKGHVLKDSLAPYITDYVRNDIDALWRFQFDQVNTSKMAIDKVIFNDPATVVIWKDGSKTVVKTAPDDVYNEWAGMALCICKKLYGDNFHKIFKKYSTTKRI